MHLTHVLPAAVAIALSLTGCAAPQTPATQNPTPPNPPTALTPTPSTQLSVAPSAEPGLNTPLALTLADSGKTVNLTNHKSITITLTGNATTGYRWDVTKLEGGALEKVGDVQYTPYNARAGTVGTPGTFLATFKPIAPGRATITMAYARPWENGTPPAQAFSVTVIVDNVPK